MFFGFLVVEACLTVWRQMNLGVTISAMLRSISLIRLLIFISPILSIKNDMAQNTVLLFTLSHSVERKLKNAIMAF